MARPAAPSPAAGARALGGPRLHRPGDLEARVVAAARAPAPLRRALARVAGRMVATRGWERLGFARLADYAAERAGLSARELRDLARVDGACAGLPALEGAFLAGALGWTQLRLLCRVASPADQRDWLALAARCTARELAREVRAVDRLAREPLSRFDTSADPEHEPRVGVVLRVSPRARARWWATRQLASRVAGQSLSHAAFAEVLTAEVLSGVAREDVSDASGEADALTAHEPARAARCDTGGTSPSPQRRRPPVSASSAAAHAVEASERRLPPTAEISALEHDLDAADAFELDRRLRLAVRLEARWLARVARRMALVVAWGLHRDLGYRSVDAWAEERLGMAASRARALLRIERAARECPPLREAFAEGRLSWIQAHALAPLLLEPEVALHRSDWIAHAARVSVRRLEDDVERALALGAYAPPPLDLPAPFCQDDRATGSGTGSEDGDCHPAGLQTGAIARLPKQDACLFFSATPEVAALFRALLATVQRRLERARGRPSCRSEALEVMLDHARSAWQPERRRSEDAVLERDGWRCTTPGFRSFRHLEKHHVVFRSRRGSDAPSNLTTLCAWHHRHGVHGRVLRCTGVAPGGLRFELGLRSDDRPLAVYRSADVVM